MSGPDWSDAHRAGASLDPARLPASMPAALRDLALYVGRCARPDPALTADDRRTALALVPALAEIGPPHCVAVDVAISRWETCQGHARTAQIARRDLRAARRAYRLTSDVADRAGGARLDQQHEDVTQALVALGYDSPPLGLPIPDGYQIIGDDGAVLRVLPGDAGGARLVCSGLLALTGRAIDPATGHAYLRLGWRYAGRWVEQVHRRDLIATRGGLAGLALDGAPLHASTISEVQAWVAALEAAAGDLLPTSIAASRMGWVSDDRADGFVVGRDPIGCASGTVDLVGVPAGSAALPDEYGLGGNVTSWRRDVWTPASESPRVALCVYAALAAPLLAIIPEAGPFVFEFGASTSQGKSVALEAACSVWGRPDGILGRWESTSKGLQLRGGFHPAIPLIMDDTKEALSGPGGLEKVSQVIYAYTSRGSRSVSSADGQLEVRPRIRGVILMAGETAAADLMAGSPGAIARLVTVRGAPWRVAGAVGARTADCVRLAASTHYGHLGRLWVAHLSAMADSHAAALRARYVDLVERYGSDAGALGTAQRGAAHVALLRVVAEEAARALDLPIVEEATDEAIAALRAQTVAADVGVQGLHAIWSWAIQHAFRLDGHESRAGVSLPPTQGWAGAWLPHERGPRVINALLDRALSDAGLDAPSVRRAWSERGLVRPVRARIAGRSVQATALTDAALDLVDPPHRSRPAQPALDDDEPF